MAKIKKEKSDIELLNECSDFIKNTNWQYEEFLEYDYDTYNECSTGSGCCDNDYCRCGVIENAHITSFDTNKLCNFFTLDIKNEILKYCVDRIIHNLDLTDKYNWDIDVHGGYYGQEIGGVRLNPSIADNFTLNINKLIKTKTDFDKLKIVLELEYGYLIPLLKNNNFNVEILSVNPSKINFGNEDHMIKTSKKDLKIYDNYDLPRAVCFKKSFKIIDGYHRTTSALKNKLETIKIIALSEVK